MGYVSMHLNGACALRLALELHIGFIIRESLSDQRDDSSERATPPSVSPQLTQQTACRVAKCDPRPSCDCATPMQGPVMGRSKPPAKWPEQAGMHP